MDLLTEITVDKLEQYNEKTWLGVIPSTGQPVILKEDLYDEEFIEWLSGIRLAGVPAVMGKTRLKAGAWAYVFEWLEGESLTGRRWSAEEARQAIFQVRAILEDLTDLAGRQVVHLDLQPDQIIKTDDSYALVGWHSAGFEEHLMPKAAADSTDQKLASVWLELLLGKPLTDCDQRGLNRLLASLPTEDQIKLEGWLGPISGRGSSAGEFEDQDLAISGQKPYSMKGLAVEDEEEKNADSSSMSRAIKNLVLAGLRVYWDDPEIQKEMDSLRHQ